MLKDKRCYDKAFMSQEYPPAMEESQKSMSQTMYGQGQAMYNQGMCCPVSTCPTMCPPIMECPQERCCHRYICHEVPHVIPCNTRIINHHVYRHTFTPSYTCCEENTCTNVQCGSCCQFR